MIKEWDFWFFFLFPPQQIVVQKLLKEALILSKEFHSSHFEKHIDWGFSSHNINYQ